MICVAHALATADVGAKLISLSTVESDLQLQAAERKMGRSLEQTSAIVGSQVSFIGVLVEVLPADSCRL
jgi:hypothetical protein